MSGPTTNRPFSGNSVRVLIIEDIPADVELTVAILKRAGYSLAFDAVNSPGELQEKLSRNDYDMILCDHNLGTWLGTEALEMVQRLHKDVPFVVLTAALGDEAAVEYLKRGATDYLLKHRLPRLPGVVGGVLREKAHRDEARRLQQEVLRGKREWELTFDAVPSPVVLLDEQCRVVRANRAAADMLGLSFAQLIGSHWCEAVDPSTPHGPACHLSRRLEGAGSTRLDLAIPRIGRVFDTTASPVLDPAGARTGYVCVMTDVTEHKRAEEALTESEARFRSLVETTADWIWEVDSEGVYSYASPKVKDLLGYEPAEVVGKRPFDFMAPGEAKRLRPQVLAKLAARQPLCGVVNVALRKDGRAVILETNGLPILDAAGNLRGYRGIDRDITERKKAEETLRHSEELFRTLFEEAPVAYHEIDREGIIRRVNRTECGLLGYAPEEMLGRPVWEFVAPEQRDIARDVVRRKLAAPYQPGPFHREWLRRDGGRLIVEMHENVILDSQGQVSAIRTATLDITERQRAEEALRASEERYRSLVDNATYGIYRVTADGALLDVNPAFVEMLGYPSKEDLLTRNIATDIYRTAEERDRLIQQSLTADRLDSVETQFRRRDGTLLTVRLAGKAFREPDGAISSFEMIAENVTERKALEEQLRQAQRMEAVGRLAGGVAHDFNNLLMVIQGYSDLLLQSPEPADTQRQPLEEIRKAAERASALIRQLLAFSRKQVLQAQVLNLNMVVANVEKMLRRVIGEDIELTVLPGAELNRVMADPGQIEQVIMNLAINARDAMPRGGKLTIETANVDLDEDYARRHGGVQPGPYARLSVSDTGCGMDAETQAHIFEPFFTTKERSKGTGLGLATVYGIVKQSGGNIWVYSEVGRGTVFKIYLPRAPQGAEVRQQAEVQQQLPGGVETILVAEDDAAVQALVCGALADRGYTVLEARDGPEALAAAQEHKEPIHLLVTDVVLPHMSGRKLSQRLLAQRPETRLLYMSGYTDDAIVNHGVLAGNAPFLQKPFSADALSRKVREVLDQPHARAGRKGRRARQPAG
jgi:PAS domain S-box-containing protein